MGENIKEEIVRSAQKVQSYGLMVDEVTDISVQSQMLTFIQFVSPVTSCVEITFLSVQNVLEEFASANADALTSLIKDELQKCSLSLTNLKGLATDGASVMTGKNNGKSKQLLVKRMKKACSTRWLSFDKSVAALYQEYEAVLHTLKALDEDDVLQLAVCLTG